jgi:uncharacterized protein
MEKQRKTKILAVGDIHADKGLAKKLSKLAEKEKVDLVIFAGDITWGDMETEDIVKPFEKMKKQVLMIPGNHEPASTIDSISQAYQNAKSIHGYSFQKGDLGIFGAGTVDWAEESPEKSEIFQLLKKGNRKLKDSKKKIMVTHMHPHKSKAEFSGFEGSKAVRQAIKKFHPDIAICSHIHEAGGLQEKIGTTKVIHVSRKPKVFEI